MNDSMMIVLSCLFLVAAIAIYMVIHTRTKDKLEAGKITEEKKSHIEGSLTKNMTVGICIGVCLGLNGNINIFLGAAGGLFLGTVVGWFLGMIGR